MKPSTATVIAMAGLTIASAIDLVTTVEAWIAICAVSLFGVEMLLEDIREEINND